jgi:hypothetical protein
MKGARRRSMSRMWLRLAASLASILVGCAVEPSPSPSPVPLAPVEAARLATLKSIVIPQWEPGPDGRQVGVEGRPKPFRIRPPAELLVLEGPRQVGDIPWYRVYVQQRPGLTETRQDFFAWIPGILDGRRTIELGVVEPCGPPTVAGIAEVSVIGRARCYGAASITLVGHSWWRRDDVRPIVRPAWLGTESDATTVALYEPGADIRLPGNHGPWVELRIPPGVTPPPFDFDLRIEGQFNHLDSAGCTRRSHRQLGLPVMPDEAPDDSASWCRGQFVVSDWDVVNGPEGRPLEPNEVQLHRFDPPSFDCGGVAMGRMTWHIDPSQPDPIWLEVDNRPLEDIRVVPYFSSGFRAVRTPELVVIDSEGVVVVRDEEKLDPDEGLLGHGVCPAGRWVSIVEVRT